MPWMTIPIALAIGGGASAATSIYSAKRAGKTNDRALEAQERSDASEVDLRREELAEVRRQQEARQASDDRRWNDYVRINEPTWRTGAGLLRSLYDIAGGGGQAPAYQPPAQPSAGVTPTYAGTAPRSSSGMTPRTVRPRTAVAQSPIPQMWLSELMSLALSAQSMGKVPTPSGAVR